MSDSKENDIPPRPPAARRPTDSASTPSLAGLVVHGAQAPCLPAEHEGPAPSADGVSLGTKKFHARSASRQPARRSYTGPEQTEDRDEAQPEVEPQAPGNFRSRWGLGSEGR
jgi:hypothetical protein